MCEGMKEDLFEQRKIIFNEAVTEDIIETVYYPMDQMSIADPKKPIHLYINSCGGNTYEGLFIASYILTSKTPIYTYILGTAQSAACAIAVAGHKRFAYTYSQIMMHFSKCDSEPRDSKNLLSVANAIQNLDQHILDLFAKKTKLSKKQLEDKLSTDYFLTPKQAVKEGFIDKVL